MSEYPMGVDIVCILIDLKPKSVEILEFWIDKPKNR